MYHECDATEGHRVPSTYRRSARQFSGLGLNIDGTVWYRLMYIHRASRSPQSNQRERYLSLVLRQEKRKPPLLRSGRFWPHGCFHDEGRRGISDYHLGRGTDCRVLLSAPFLSLSCQIPVLPLSAYPTSVMMNGVAGGSIYSEIQRPGGIY